MSSQQQPQLPRGERRRRRAGRPLTLALGWVLSCVLITAVTLTAVDRVGREVSDSSNLLSPQGETQPIAAASTSIAVATPSSQPPTPSVTVSAVTTSASVRPTVAPPVPTKSATPRPTTPPPAPAPTTTPPHSPSPTPTSTPVGIEYVFVCRDGKAVGGAVTPSSTPIPSPSSSPTAPSGSASASTSSSISPSVSPSSSPSPTTSPSTSKILEDVPGGVIVIACSGNTIANANASVSDPTYTLTVRSTSDPEVDVFFGKTT